MTRLVRRTTLAAALALSVGLLSVAVASASANALQPLTTTGPPTATPIKHVVVIFQENVSFDHYFGTYPVAANPAREPRFTPRPGTPSVNGLQGGLLYRNPNLANPQRLDRSQALTCDMNHDYTPEQLAFDHGLMDRFVQFTAGSDCTDRTQVMDYYDGNTVTALWQYAQHFSMSDNSFETTFGPSTPGAINLVSGQTHGATPAAIPDAVANGTITGDPDPAFDRCSSSPTVALSGRNVGDLLNAKSVTWGWFQGGFSPSARSAGTVACDTSHANIAGEHVTDYSAHHEPFQYYRSTANPLHLPPSSVQMVGHTDQANHQYDLSTFWQAAGSGHLPAVSFLKAPKYQDGHAGYSDPLDEQHFLVNTINRLERLPTWSSTAVVIAYDDSDGWYDHVMSPIVNPSRSAEDALSGPGQCGNGPSLRGFADRCGHGPRLPLLVVSPFAKFNAVDHSMTDQTSILAFIEHNWDLPKIGNGSFDVLAGSLGGLFDFRGAPTGRLFLDPVTGEPARS